LRHLKLASYLNLEKLVIKFVAAAHCSPPLIN
jgi:hypothetical protein